MLVRQRPGNGKMVFVTLEDETGVVNVALYSTVFERFRKEVMASRLMAVEGRVQKSWAGVVHMLGNRVSDRSEELARLSEGAGGSAPDRASIRAMSASSRRRAISIDAHADIKERGSRQAHVQWTRGRRRDVEMVADTERRVSQRSPAVRHPLVGNSRPATPSLAMPVEPSRDEDRLIFL